MKEITRMWSRVGIPHISPVISMREEREIRVQKGQGGKNSMEKKISATQRNTSRNLYKALRVLTEY